MPLASSINNKNAKNKNKQQQMRIFLALQNTYDTVQFGLFQDEILIDFHEVHKHHLSKNLVPLLVVLLQHHNLQLQQLSFIAVNIGPAPFSTLRALLALVNGINFASNIPLVGIDGLILLAHEENDSVRTAIILNAFNNDVYYAYPSDDGFATGWCNMALLLPKLKEANIKRLIGNAVPLHQQLLESAFPDSILAAEPSHASLENIALQALIEFEKGNVQNELFPLYVKNIEYKKSL